MSGVNKSPRTSAQVMREVMLALIPGTCAYCLWFGPDVVANVLLAGCAAVVAEALVLALRRKPLRSTLADGSAFLSGWLLALALPPLLPWGITVFGGLVAMLLGKHLFGGLGGNPFNPAMVGYAVLLVSFPIDMTAWTAPAALPGAWLSTSGWDAITMATPLDQIKTALRMMDLQSVLNDQTIMGAWAGRGWEWINLGFLLGGIALLIRRTIDWRIPVAMLATLCSLSTIDYLLTDTGSSPLFALFSGATMLGAFFIATDPVSAATSPFGRILFASGIGILLFVIRKWGGYPDGLAFAVLLMNLTAPSIDYYCRPRAFGE